MASTYLSRDISSTSTPKKMTCSFWIKRAGSGNSTQRIFSQSNNGAFDMYWRWETGDVFTAWNELNSGGTLNSITPNMKFRDFGAWYHIVLRWDTTQSTSTDRIRMYVNGTNIDDLGGYSSYTAPSLNDDIGIFSSTSNKFDIGYYRAANNEHLDSILSHVHVCDGYSYGPESFGSTDGTTGEWKINPSPNVSYGTNGFFLFNDNASVNDQSGNGNNFTLGSGSIHKTEDNPSNIFATLNPLYRKPQSNPSELTNGNTGVIGGSAHRADVPTIAVNSGKWYMEAKAISGNTTKWWWGLGKVEILEEKQNLGNTDNFIYGDVAGTQGVYSDNLKVDGSTAISGIFSGAIAANDIAMIAVDLDNQKVWYGLNGTWNNGSASQSSTFNSSSPDSTALTAGEYYYIGVGNENTKWHTNYGNGYFGTSAVSSAGTNASNFGIFEYDVPAGFTALCTKGLNL